MKRASNAFTLIEILTVITIIAILVAMLFPAIKMALIKAEGAPARTFVQHAGTAFRAYFAEYSIWPTNSNETTVFNLTTNLFRNTASLTFLHVPSYSVKTVGGVVGVVVDPWGNPYRCVVDGVNYGGVLRPDNANWIITNGYAIWSGGPDGTNDPSSAQDVGVNRDNIRSW